jgi:phosphomannomutase/phosphoglucomutase
MNFGHIFRSYDIRGVFGKDLTTDLAKKIGKGIGTFFGEGKKLTVGMDVRLSGKKLKKALIDGLTSTGIDVIDIGVVPTPVLYFSIVEKHTDGGIMITASHNPPEWNGFKVCGKGGFPIGQGSGLEKIKNFVMNEEFKETKKIGKVEKYEKILEDYSKFVLGKINIKRKLKIVLDTGNGATALIAPKLLKNLGNEVITINEKLDGTFPSRSPEPSKEALKELSKEVVKNRADFGAGFDGDGDRVVFVDEKGRIILSGSIVIIIFSDYYLKKQKNAKIVFDVCCSSSVEEFIRKNGGIPIISKVGITHIKEKTMKKNAIFGGEYSNHLYFSEMYGFDDAIFATLKMDEILSQSEKTFSQIVDSIPKYPGRFDWNFECPDDKKFKVIEKMKSKFQESGLKFSDLDGIKLFFDNGWIIWRVSNTQPKIRICVEARTEERFKQLCELAEKELKEAMESD